VLHLGRGKELTEASKSLFGRGLSCCFKQIIKLNLLTDLNETTICDLPYRILKIINKRYLSKTREQCMNKHEHSQHFNRDQKHQKVINKSGRGAHLQLKWKNLLERFNISPHQTRENDP
jgi:hypothetical protein